jgi:hypothetical protein
MADSKKNKPTKAPKDKPADKEKQKAVAFVNWKIPLNNGGEYRSSRGFPIFQNPEFRPNIQEDYLVDLAKRHGGTVELTMRVKVSIYTPNEAPKEEDLPIIAAEA